MLNPVSRSRWVRFWFGRNVNPGGMAAQVPIREQRTVVRKLTDHKWYGFLRDPTANLDGFLGVSGPDSRRNQLQNKHFG